MLTLNGVSGVLRAKLQQADQLFEKVKSTFSESAAAIYEYSVLLTAFQNSKSSKDRSALKSNLSQREENLRKYAAEHETAELLMTQMGEHLHFPSNKTSVLGA